MAYIGKSPVIGNFVKLDAITAVNGQAAYTMQNGGSNFTDYESVNQFLVSLNGTIQAPTDSFTVSGSTLTFASNLSTGDVIDFIMVFGNSLSAGTPTDATVTTAKLADSAVTAAKITDATITSAKIASGVIQNQSAFKNIVINGDMSIAQRATSTASITGNGYHTIDRYKTVISSAGTWTQSQSTTVPSGQGFATSLKMDCTTADASLSASDKLYIEQNIEGQFLQYLKKGTSSAESVTLSFWVRSNKTGTYIAAIKDNDNSRYISKSYTISAADTWEKKTITFAGDTTGTLGNDNATSFRLNFWLAAGSNFTSGTLATDWESETDANKAVGQVNLADSTSNEWYITGVQLEAGTSASDFEFLPHDINRQRCLRYYYKYNEDGSNNAVGVSHGLNTGEIFCDFYYPQKMRSTPSFSISSSGNFSVQTGAQEITCNSFTTERNNRTNIILKFGVTGSSGIGQGTCATLLGGGSSRLIAEAEL